MHRCRDMIEGGLSSAEKEARRRHLPYSGEWLEFAVMPSAETGDCRWRRAVDLVMIIQNERNAKLLSSNFHVRRTLQRQPLWTACRSGTTGRWIPRS